MFRMLVVQPERIFLNLFARALRQGGHDVFVADNDGAALNCLRKESLDLILCGFTRRPSPDDFEMIRRLREVDEQISIVVASTSGLNCVPDLVEAGASLVVSRSLHAEDVAGLVEEIAQNARRMRAFSRHQRLAAIPSMPEFPKRMMPAFLWNAVGSE